MMPLARIGEVGIWPSQGKRPSRRPDYGDEGRKTVPWERRRPVALAHGGCGRLKGLIEQADFLGFRQEVERRFSEDGFRPGPKQMDEHATAPSFIAAQTQEGFIDLVQEAPEPDAGEQARGAAAIEPVRRVLPCCRYIGGE